MLIPLGFLAASGVSAGSFDLLETQVLGSDAASVTFSSLSTYSSYKHLQIRMTARSSRADTADSYRIQFNGDTAANYSFHQLDGTGGGTPGSAATASVNYIQFGAGLPGNNATSNSFSASVIDILDAYDTNKYKTLRGLAGWTGGFQIIELTSGSWRNTNALSSILIYAAAGNLKSTSRFSLYGIKGAA